MTSTDRTFVRDQYESEDRLETRRAVWRGDSQGRQPQDVAAASIASVAPTSILEVGCGTGEFAARLLGEHPTATLVATDQSMRMVNLTRKGGVDARVADVMDLPFDDARFDVVVAMWMLYHVPDLYRALAQVRRVLRPGGRLVLVDENFDDPTHPDHDRVRNHRRDPHHEFDDVDPAVVGAELTAAGFAVSEAGKTILAGRPAKLVRATRT